MTSITIPLTDDHLQRIRSLADQLGISVEELTRAVLEDWLAGPPAEFQKAATMC